MLFAYRLFSHDITKLHEFLEHTVLEVWCKADETIPFSIDLLHDDFTSLYTRKNKLQEDIEKIYAEFINLSIEQKELISQSFIKNNQIEELCKGIIEPIYYKDIENLVNKEFTTTLKEFNNYLYKFLDKKDASFVKNFTSATLYYKELVKQLPASSCPFCGIEKIKSHRMSKRDAYDHYLPKSLFPFTAINVKNLAPMCKDCNEYWKYDNNPIMTNKDKGDFKKAFYPFSNLLPVINISFSNLVIDPFDEDKHILNINYISDGYEEEVDRWLKIFNIKKRYDERLRNDLHYWLEEVRILTDREESLSETEYIQNKEEHKFVESNFLTIPFLLACEERGLI